MSATEHERTARPLRTREWRILALLGIPTFVLALAITAVTTYLPVQLEAGKTSTTVIGLLIGAEGLVALFVPLLAGAWSDRLRTRWGGRLPFIVLATPPMAAALALMGLVGGLGAAALLLVVFFAAYYAGYEPYRALYPDLVDDDIAGRAQSAQAVFRGLGTFVALVGGGLLIAVWQPAPFVVAAAVSALGTAAFTWAVLRRGVPAQDQARDRGVRGDARRLWRQLRDRADLRLYLVANGLWELALGALKTFVVLYLTRGLGLSVSMSAAVIGAVAVLLVATAPVSGRLADRHGIARVMQWALLAYGLGLLVPFLLTAKVGVALAVPLIAFGGGVVMTLPYALLMPLMEEEAHGAATGFYSFSRGIGTALGPLLAGVAIAATTGLFAGTHGYQATWGVCAAAILLSVVPLARLRRLTG
jgi:MFS family permease